MEEKKTPKERKIVDVRKDGAQAKAPAKAAAKKAAEDTAVVETAARAETTEKTPKARATTLRVIAVLLWLLAIGCEVLVITILNGILYIPGDKNIWLIGGIVLDLILVVIGSQLWKKSNRIDPVSEKNKVKFFLWNNMGVIAAVLAFLPLIVILLKDKKMDKKMKKIVTAVAAVALLAAVAFSVDYNPVSQEDLESAKEESVALGDGTAYWTQWGRSYHFDPDCQTLRNSATLYQGTVEDAFEANRTDPCDFCAGGAEAKAAAAETAETATETEAAAETGN